MPVKKTTKKPAAKKPAPKTTKKAPAVEKFEAFHTAKGTPGTESH